MKFAAILLAHLGFGPQRGADAFDQRLRSMISPATTGPRLRRVAPPALFVRGGHQAI